MKPLLLLLVLRVGSIAFANGQQSAQGNCDSAHSLALRASGREAFDKHQYEVAARRFSDALDACPSQRDLLIELSEAQAHSRQTDLAIRSAQESNRFRAGEEAEASGPVRPAGRMGLTKSAYRRTPGTDRRSTRLSAER